MKMQTADMCDAHSDEVEVLEPGLVSYGGVRRFCGPVATLVVFEDNVLVREALAEPGNGRILVVDGGESHRCALLGDKLGAMAVANGWAGVVVNGCVRDSVELGSLDLGVLALGTCPRKSNKEGEGRRDEMVRFGGVSISPGNFIYVDEDGVLISERDLATG